MSFSRSFSHDIGIAEIVETELGPLLPRLHCKNSQDETITGFIIIPSTHTGLIVRPAHTAVGVPRERGIWGWGAGRRLRFERMTADIRSYSLFRAFLKETQE